MRTVQIIATVVLAAVLAVTGCAVRATTDQTGPPAPSGAPSVTPTHPTAAPTPTTNTPAPNPAGPKCAISPKAGPAGSLTTLTCSGFAPSEPVAITFLAEVLTTTKATADGGVASSFPVPTGFAGSHYPGRKDTFHAKGRQSGNAASATFTVTG